MNVVNFAEGILGIDKTSAPTVAKYLRHVAENEVIPSTPLSSVSMIAVAEKLEHGDRVEIELIREIGEINLDHTRQLCMKF